MVLRICLTLLSIEEGNAEKNYFQMKEIKKALHMKAFLIKWEKNGAPYAAQLLRENHEKVV